MDKNWIKSTHIRIIVEIFIIIYLWSTKRNLPSIACRETNFIGLKRGFLGKDVGNVDCNRPTATKHDRLQASPSPSPSCSSRSIFAGAQDFRYPVHCITQYFQSVKICDRIHLLELLYTVYNIISLYDFQLYLPLIFSVTYTQHCTLIIY